MAELLLVSLGATPGLRASDAELAGALERAGARVRVVQAHAPGEVRTLALTDLRWALSARAAARQALAEGDADAVIYSTVTAALFWPRPGAIRFDAPARANRPGRHGLWQRPLERRRLRQAPLLLPWSELALAEARAPLADAVVVPVAVEPSAGAADAAARDVAAVTYAGNPRKKGLDRVLDAWARARRPGEELVVAGVDRAPPGEGVRVVGRLERSDYRALLRRSRVYVTAPRREDYGLAQLEALAEGCMLVTAPAPGPYAALTIARELDPRLVGEDLAAALRAALDAPRAGYAAAAAAALEPFGRQNIDRIVADELLPRLSGARA
jgi:glycosyltransferase involved in cell wall biosynthesis